jgi:hypothetical protein
MGEGSKRCHERSHGRSWNQVDTVSTILRVNRDRLRFSCMIKARGGGMAIQSSEERHRSFSPRSEEDTILESSLESFPASDPPAWVSGKDIPPKASPLQPPERLPSDLKKVAWLKRLTDYFRKRPQSLKDDSSVDRPCCRDPH